jgi:AAA+ superfamily predicted ATPase
MKSRIINYLKAGYPGLALQSHEEHRCQAMLRSVADDLGYHIHNWSLTTGRTDVATGQSYGEDGNPVEVLDGIMGAPEKTLCILNDYHHFLDQPNPVVYRKIKEVLWHAKASQKCLILLAPTIKLPPDLEKMMVLLDFELPSKDELTSVIDNLCKSNDRTLPDTQTLGKVLDALSGLTTTEAEDALALTIIETGSFDTKIITREKANAVKKNGLLEIITNNLTLDDIGGLDVLKADLLSKRNLFTPQAHAYGLDTPRGFLAVGQAGTGKSLTSQACGNIFGIPLLRLDAGNIFGSLVGESERNWRAAFATAKAIAPCVLWIDEVDGLTSGAASSGKTDGGTTNRVFKSILQDMQYNAQGIFFVFTANDIDAIPDPLIDRLDVWAVDLPNAAEREAIWRIHIAKRNRQPDSFNLTMLANATDGFSGRQIEQAWLKAMTLAFNAEREPTTADCVTSLASFTPTSVTMADTIEARRRRLAGKATNASTPSITKINNHRKLAA